MSEQASLVPDEAAVPQPTALGLKEAREKAGLHLVALAAMLKVPVHRLEALESGRFHELPDMTFARALASTVCRTLKIDPAPVLAALPGAAATRLGEPIGSLNAPMPASGRSTVAKAPASNPSRIPWAPALALVVLVAAGTLWLLLPPRAPNPEPPVAVVAAPSSDTPLLAQPAQVSESAATAPPVVASTSVDAAVAAAPVLPAAVSPAAADAGVLQISATEATWLQITGASGRVLLQRGLQPGEQVSFANDLPLAVVVGRADGVQVTVRGNAFDLAPVTRSNVARFEVR